MDIYRELFSNFIENLTTSSNEARFVNVILKAPQAIVSLFSGSRQVVYGLVDNCTQVRTTVILVVITFLTALLK